MFAISRVVDAPESKLLDSRLMPLQRVFVSFEKRCRFEATECKHDNKMSLSNAGEPIQKSVLICFD